MFWRNGNAVAKPSDEEWPGLGTWFESSECCPECQPFLEDQQRTIAEARARAAEPKPEPKALPPGLGIWYPNSEECPECQPYLEEQAKTIAKAINRPSAPARAIAKAKARTEAILPYLEEPIPDMGDFEWDMPEDHEMSTQGKALWHVAIYGPIVALPIVAFVLSPFSREETLRHWAAMPGCSFASMVGVAPARQDQPGYHSWLDPDSDGLACETKTASRQLSGGGNSHFQRVGGD
ncbi:MAG: excalibur calcium-binding domain-containing protein [Pseudomonadota bacterium]